MATAYAFPLNDAAADFLNQPDVKAAISVAAAAAADPRTDHTFEEASAPSIVLDLAHELQHASFPVQARTWHQHFLEGHRAAARETSDADVDAFADKVDLVVADLCEAPGRTACDVSLKLKAGLAILRYGQPEGEAVKIAAEPSHHDWAENLLLSATRDAERLTLQDARAREHDRCIVQSYDRFRDAFRLDSASNEAAPEHLAEMDAADEILLHGFAATPVGVALKLKRLFVSNVGEAWADQAMIDPAGAEFREGLANASVYHRALWSCIGDLLRMGDDALLQLEEARAKTPVAQAVDRYALADREYVRADQLDSEASKLGAGGYLKESLNRSRIAAFRRSEATRNDVLRTMPETIDDLLPLAVISSNVLGGVLEAADDPAPELEDVALALNAMSAYLATRPGAAPISQLPGVLQQSVNLEVQASAARNGELPEVAA